ncbi:MAG: hypothetical protein KC635_06255 [Myxococcales bacterium]|nr:hypothetical protein [Myxococcales bacterium]MCB9733272.1 hypothetical protein [Deltaproteobacteria bacterium]
MSDDGRDAAPRRVLSRAEVFAGMTPGPSFVRELERHGLVSVVARDGGGEPWYAMGARASVERVMKLVDAGYRATDIAVIAGKIGVERPRRRGRLPVLLGLAAAVEEIGVDEATLRAWLGAGYVRASAVTGGGAPLLDAEAVAGAKELADWRVLGFGDETLATWAAVQAGDGAVHNGDLLERINVLRRSCVAMRKVARRVEKRLGAVEKELREKR